MYQDVKYMLTPVREIQLYLNSIKLLSEEEAFGLSLQLEARVE